MILTSILYRVQTLTSQTMKNQKIARSPHTLGRLNACANSVYQALFRFLRAPGTRLAWEVYAGRWQGRIPTANTYYTTLRPLYSCSKTKNSVYGNILLRSLTKQLILFAFSMPMHTYKAKLCMKQNIQYISVHEKKQYYFVTKKN